MTFIDMIIQSDNELGTKSLKLKIKILKQSHTALNTPETKNRTIGKFGPTCELDKNLILIVT